MIAGVHRWAARKVRARLSLDEATKRLSRRRGLVTLCYHTVSEALADYPHQNDFAALEAHLLYLKAHFEVLGLAEALRHLEAGDMHNVERPCVHLTFDDGFRDNFERVAPLLEKHDLPATLFAAVGAIEDENSTYMGTSELRTLASSGQWTIGAHSLSHNSLYSYDDADLERQIMGSRERLEDILGKPVPYFSYPQGKISRRVVEAARPHFDYAFSGGRRLGAGFDRHQIRRCGTSKVHDDLTQFARLLLSVPWEDGTS